MAKRNVKRIVLTVACVAVMLFGSMSMAFAADNAKTEAYMTVPATLIDFEITDRIDMVGSAGSTDLTVTDLVVTNKSDIGVLSVTSVEAEPITGWTLADQNTAWKNLAANAQTFGLVAGGSFDMATGAYAPAGDIEAGQSQTTKFTGNVGLVTNAINAEKVADVIVTVAFK